MPGRRLGLPEEGTSQEQQQQQPQQDQRQPEQQPQPLSPQEEPRQNPPVAAETQDALLSPGPSSRPDDNAANRQRAHTVAVALPTLSMRVSDSIADAAPGRASEDIHSLPPPYRDAPPAYDEVDRTRPQDFEGEIQTTDDIPSNETLKSIENYIVLDRHGRTHPFRSLYTGPNVARRVLVIFIRHFFCGVSQSLVQLMIQAALDCIGQWCVLLGVKISIADITNIRIVKNICGHFPNWLRPPLCYSSQSARSSLLSGAVTLV